MKYQVWVSTGNPESPYYTGDQADTLFCEVDDYVQLTYSGLRGGPDGDDILLMDTETGFWHPRFPYDKEKGGWQGVELDKSVGYSDIVISAVKQGRIQYGDDPVESQGEK